ncbi:cyclin-dependent protein kinase inhibitor SMR6 [Andrographis paniculata]|uniref:cyclin-dependent protein kinase inhibitor SMR6 n=1 Tax=Andrographis paniculata TaxID=175694 RepID=UPI0021E8C7E7|nr:cyclin-dependent protein kinase inhibitor SMR6 [Andrographis paniculata]
MGFSKKHNNQVEARKESEGKKWVIAGIAAAIRGPLKPICTKAASEDHAEDKDACNTTPTARESRIPEIWTCPPAPRKRRPTSKPNVSGAIEFFNPPDLESVFLCHRESED